MTALSDKKATRLGRGNTRRGLGNSQTVAMDRGFKGAGLIDPANLSFLNQQGIREDRRVPFATRVAEPPAVPLYFAHYSPHR